MFTFIGDFACRTDAKGRVVFPSAFKKGLGEGDVRLVVRKDLFESCLVIYPFSVWEEELIRIRAKLNPYNREHNRFLRNFFRGSAEVSLDGNGRFLIPKRLMEQIDAGREVVLLGVDRFIEVWSKEAYEEGELSRGGLGDLAEKILGETDSGDQI
ncbi:division/cell wall cluster transcriptional repressor MraZ [Marinilabilia sp.]|jgi:MraZ protein